MTSSDIPPTRRDDLVDVLHGVAVADPYRWLEAGDDPDVVDWVGTQNARTRSMLDSRPDRASWHRRLTALLELPVAMGAQLRGDLLVSLERAAGAQQPWLVVRSAVDRTAAPRVIVDPSGAAVDATVAIDWFSASPSGDLVAFGLSEGGTEDSTLRVVRTADATLLDDAIPGTRACSVGWEPDDSGFCYTRYPEGDQYHRTVHHHTLGDDWRADPVVWADHPTPQTWPEVDVSPDGVHVLVSAMVGWSRYDLHLLDRRTGTWHTLLEGVDAITDLVFGHDGRLYGSTTLDAPRGRIVSIPVDEPPADPSGWTTVVAERDVVVSSPRVAGGSLLLTATRRATDTVEQWALDGSWSAVVDDLGLVAVDAISADADTGRAFVLTNSFTTPSAMWRLEPDPAGSGAGAALTARRWYPDEPASHTLPSLVVDEVSYRSPDGTEIGMFLVHRSDVVPDTHTPAILTGYGGFAISETPAWSTLAAAWCATGGTFAVAGLRGGFEHGEEWHRAGARDRKQNVFDDFHAGADWLVETGRTSRERLAVAGGSNGGLLVGAALTQRPDLARAVWCAVPLLDMVRFHEFLIARLWTEEYGDPDVAEDFEWLYAYSPYHRVRDGVGYPAVLLTTAEGDTRVDPMHARKMAAALQHASSCQPERPILLHQEDRAGHGVGKPVGKRADEQADVLTFLTWQLEGDEASAGGGR
jgi:prolyl oligopeptidase